MFVVGAWRRTLRCTNQENVSVFGLVATCWTVPVVCAVSGYAVGIGFQIALASDFVVADTTATFWQPFVARGMTPDSGASWLTTRAVGPLRARQLLLLGRRLDAATAEEWGIVHEVTEPGAASARAAGLAAELARGPPWRSASPRA